jgi:hypothetical protein
LKARIEAELSDNFPTRIRVPVSILSQSSATLCPKINSTDAGGIDTFVGALIREP